MVTLGDAIALFVIVIGVLAVLVIGAIMSEHKVEDCRAAGGVLVSDHCIANEAIIPLEGVR